MHTGKGQVIELALRDGFRQARVACAAGLIPAPGQYLLTGASSSSLLPDPVFYIDSAPEGFLAAPAPDWWTPGLKLFLRGPLGRGFLLPASARKIALLSLSGSALRLYSLIQPALKQGASVVMVNSSYHEHLPDAVEIQPISVLEEILSWADWVAVEAAREELPILRDMLGRQKQTHVLHDAEILVRTPVPCGGIAECGVCTLVLRTGWKMACREGPVFRWAED
jgi:dihydroorotate dehydrogenase electron transfer subunit